jgi:hypothetical protein
MSLRKLITDRMRRRALRKINHSLFVQRDVADNAYARGDMRRFYEAAGYARELAAQREAIVNGTEVPIDATDFWRAVTVLAVLMWAGVFLYVYSPT